jgi:AAA domain
MHQQFNWETCVSNFTLELTRSLAAERAVDELTIDGLRNRSFLGACFVEKWNARCISFPIRAQSCEVYRAHCRSPRRNGDGKFQWSYVPEADPQARPITALVFGDPNTATKRLIFESQWDGISAIDRLDLFNEIDAGETCLIATRGADFGARLKAFTWPAAGAAVYAFPQNDDAGRKWLANVVTATGGAYVVGIPAAHKDLNDWVKDGAAAAYDLEGAMEHSEFKQPAEAKPEDSVPTEEPRIYIEFLSPSQILAYTPPSDLVLVGDNHLVRGSVTVLAGPPGVGKSRGSLALAEAGATKVEWFGLPVHCTFRTLVIQNENGMSRLQSELKEMDEPRLEEFLRVCPPPPYGMCFWRDEFREQLKTFSESFGPHAVVLDPWNSVSRDDRAKDFLETFDVIRSVFPPGESGPALVILPHTRKPLPNERANGRALLNLLAGSYVLGSVPRTVFVMQHASDDVTEERIVFTCCKNNDGELGKRSVWVRQNGLFTAVQNFDWISWDQGGKEEVFSLQKIVEILQESVGGLRRAKIAKEITERGVSRATAYRRIEEAEKAGLIKHQSRSDVYVASV